MSNQLTIASNSFAKTLQRLNPELDPKEVSALATQILNEITNGLNNNEIPALVKRKPNGDLDLRILLIEPKID